MLLGRFHLTQIIDKPTHHTKSKSTLLDICATTCPDFILSHGIMPPSTSNHNPIYVVFKYKKCKLTCYKRDIWCLDHADWNGFRDELRKHTWEEVLQQETLDKMVELWTSTYINIAE